MDAIAATLEQGYMSSMQVLQATKVPHLHLRVNYVPIPTQTIEVWKQNSTCNEIFGGLCLPFFDPSRHATLEIH